MSDRTDSRPLLIPILGSLAAAAILLVFWVLPAEHGIDPTGFGRMAGLTGLSGEESHALEISETPPVTLSRSFELLGFESMEYKVELEQHAGIIYRWTSTAPVHFELHSQPPGAAPDYAVTYSAGDAEGESGTYVAEFPGEHGWYWANEGTEAVTIELEIHGFSDQGILYRDGQVLREELGRE